MEKRGQLSLRVLVIAALLLIVLVVVIAIFTGKFPKIAEEITDCKAKGGFCREKCEAGEAPLGKIGCKGDNICCLPMEKDK